MKMINSENSNDREKVMLDREIRILRDLKQYEHKNIVKYVDFFQHNNYACIVMEYCERGTLYEYIRKNKVITEAQFLDILTQIATGLEVSHFISLVGKHVINSF